MLARAALCSSELPRDAPSARAIFIFDPTFCEYLKRRNPGRDISSASQHVTGWYMRNKLRLRRRTNDADQYSTYRNSTLSRPLKPFSKHSHYSLPLLAHGTARILRLEVQSHTMSLAILIASHRPRSIPKVSLDTSPA